MVRQVRVATNTACGAAPATAQLGVRQFAKPRRATKGGAEGTRTPDPHTASPSGCRSRTYRQGQTRSVPGDLHGGELTRTPPTERQLRTLLRTTRPRPWPSRLRTGPGPPYLRSDRCSPLTAGSPAAGLIGR